MTARVRILFILGIVASSLTVRGDVINACVDLKKGDNKGAVRILSPGDTCKSTESPLSWNVGGPQGPAGKDGVDGRPGLPGAPGGPGAPGKDGKDGAAGAPGKDGKDGAPGQDGSGGSCTTPAPIVIGSISFDGGVAIPIYDVNGSFENPTTIGSATGGAGAGKVKFNEFTIKKTVDAQSPALFTKLATGAHFTQVVLTLHRQSASDATLTLGTVFLTSLSHETAPDPIKTLEKVGMVFGTAALAADGATACWNQVNNVSCP